MRLSLTIWAISVLAFPAIALEFEYECAHQSAYPFGMDSGEATPQYGRDRAFDVTHIKLDVGLDFVAESISGVATHTLRPIGMAATEVAFDAVNLDIRSVTDGGGSPIDFEVTNNKLRVYFANPIPANTTVTIAIDYTSTRPIRGLHFRTPRLGYSDAETQAWTQGEPEDARHWFPCIDYPNERATTEVICTVRDDYVALSNGNLVGTTHDSAHSKRTFHWRQRQDHVTYLVSLVAGPFISVQDRADGIPLFYYALPGQEDDARKTYRNTPAMMEIFQEKIGVSYPYSRYSQVSVVDFIAGGMENTTISTMTERIILDDSARLTRSMDGLIAHELAHQWFGDLMTCRDWSHIWLNEGFATYMEAVYQEHQFGRDDLIHDMLQNHKQVLAADGGEGKKPVVSRLYNDPNGVFGYRPYAKGASVLHMLRNELGDDTFWKAITAYATRHQNKVVETNDLLRTAEEVSGKSLEKFFDQWLYHTGFPALSIEYAWENDQKLAKVTVRQTQEVTDATPLFVFSTSIAFHGEGTVHVEPVSISDESHTFYVALEERPAFVRFDPESFVLKTVKFNKPKPMLFTQLKSDPSIAGRYQACEQLSEKNGEDVIDALSLSLKSDSYWGVRVKAAEALGEIDDNRALQALLDNADTAESRVRLAIVKAVATIDNPQARAALLEAIEKDPASYIVAAAIDGLGSQRDLDAIPTITRALDRDSHSEVIRSAALNALADLRAEESLESIVPYTYSPAPRAARRTAIAAIGKAGELMEDKSRAREVLTDRLADPHPFRRAAAISALVTLGDVQAIAALEKLADTSKSDREAKSAREAIRKLRTKKEPSAEMKALREEVDALKDARKKLEEQFETLDDRVKAIGVVPETEEEPGESS